MPLLVFPQTGGGGLPAWPAGYVQARAGIGLAGVTYAGWVPPHVTVTIGGVDEFSQICLDEFQVTYDLDGYVSTCSFSITREPASARVVGQSWAMNAWATGAWTAAAWGGGGTPVTTPAVGQDVKITYSTPDNYLFAGTITQCENDTEAYGPTVVVWHCTAAGYSFMMDLSHPVIERYDGVGAGTAIADMLFRFTEGGFRVGYAPQTLGNISMLFQYEAISQCFDRIADACDATWEVTPNRIVNMYPVDQYPESSGIAITNTSDVMHLRYAADLSPTRTYEIMIGEGSSATATVSPTDETVPVDDTRPFAPPEGVIGGTVATGRSVFNYASVSAGSGPGALLGCNPRQDDIQQGDTISVYVATFDVGLAAPIGATMGLSGRITHFHNDSRYSLSEAQGCVARGLAMQGTPQTGLDFSSHTEDFKTLKIGRTLICDITAPIPISDTFRIQSITLQPVAGVSVTAPQFWRHVHASNAVQTYSKFIRRLALKDEQGR